MSRLRMTAVPVMLLIIALALTGCGRNTSIEFIPQGGTYSLEDMADVALSVDISPLKDVPATEVSVLRQEYLTALRGYGSEASAVADALTRDFPLDTAAIPLHVEAANVDGTDVWLIVEAWAETGGPLEHRRLWLLDRATLGLVDSVSFR
ncbi:MAG: hypothetical protein JXA57_10115 [Armatimonadetes bacterium]|nr:hypothetical protein [Armatimonadota bacterium]MBN2822929.1 hypothetical protein [Coriobacteriia bacterium]